MAYTHPWNEVAVDEPAHPAVAKFDGTYWIFATPDSELEALKYAADPTVPLALVLPPVALNVMLFVVVEIAMFVPAIICTVPVETPPIENTSAEQVTIPTALNPVTPWLVQFCTLPLLMFKVTVLDVVLVETEMPLPAFTIYPVAPVWPLTKSLRSVQREKRGGGDGRYPATTCDCNAAVRERGS